MVICPGLRARRKTGRKIAIVVVLSSLRANQVLVACERVEIFLACKEFDSRSLREEGKLRGP